MTAVKVLTCFLDFFRYTRFTRLTDTPDFVFFFFKKKPKSGVSKVNLAVSKESILKCNYADMWTILILS